MTEPNNWILLNRQNCLDLYCKNIIYIHDREILKQYFPHAEFCNQAWINGLRLRNMIHILNKGKRTKCRFCQLTFISDDIHAIRIHVLQKHISKNKYGRLTPILAPKPEVISPIITEIIIQ